jgi:quercetin dioxygenase-like cupin family protein
LDEGTLLTVYIAKSAKIAKIHRGKRRAAEQESRDVARWIFNLGNLGTFGNEPGGSVIRKPVILVTAAVVIAITAFVDTQSKDDPLDAVRAAPDTHKLAFENAFVRVLDVRVPPGSIEKRHRHPHGMSVYFTDWTVKVTIDGRPPEVHERKAGTFAWNEAVTHTVENVGKTEGHVLRIELKH